MKILIATDAYTPQVNGVVTTLLALNDQAARHGDRIEFTGPHEYNGFPLPGYNEIKISFPSKKDVYERLLQKYDAFHIATPEGPIGYRFARELTRMNIPWTSACHTKIPEFISSRVPLVPINLAWKWMRWRTRDSQKILVPTPSMKTELESHGYPMEIVEWTRGVDRSVFKFNKPKNEEPIAVCVSRVSPEKNLEVFFNMKWSGRKIMVGDGPYLNKYKQEYPDVEFVGLKRGTQLASYYQNADVFVFPSLLDTFGVVMIEALACGTPVVGFEVTGPIDVIQSGINGYLVSDNLGDAAYRALSLDRETIHQSSLKYTWENSYNIFKSNLCIT